MLTNVKRNKCPLFAVRTASSYCNCYCDDPSLKIILSAINYLEALPALDDIDARQGCQLPTKGVPTYNILII